MKKYLSILFVVLGILIYVIKTGDKTFLKGPRLKMESKFQEDHQETQSILEEIAIDFRCSTPTLGSQNSELENKVKELYKLENKYKQIESGVFEIAESNLIMGLKQLIKSRNKYEAQFKYNLIENFESSITQTNFSSVKGEKELSDKLFVRARIEEYIFTSESCATKFLETINKFVSNESLWYDLNKAPNSIYLEENRIYFIVSGGWYMKSFYKEIVNQFESNNRIEASIES